MVKNVRSTAPWITLRNNVLNLPVSLLNVDFTVAAKAVLDIYQCLDQFRVGGSTRLVPESVPVFDLISFLGEIVVETGRPVL